MSTGRFEVYRDRAGQFRWRLRAANHEIVASGEAHDRRDDAHRAVADMLTACGVPSALSASAWLSAAVAPVVDLDEDEPLSEAIRRSLTEEDR